MKWKLSKKCILYMKTSIFLKMEAIGGHQSSWMSLMSWEIHCSCSEKLKNIYHVRFYLIEHCGLHWRTIWPLMNHLNNIPFWRPLDICNPFLKSNLKNTEKFFLKSPKKSRPEVLRLLEASFKCDHRFFWKPTRYRLGSNVKNFQYHIGRTQTRAIFVQL